MSAIIPGLVELLTSWLPEQRWYAGKGRTLDRLEADVVGELDGSDHRLRYVVVTAHYVSGDPETYHVPLAFRESADDTHAHALVGMLDGPVYDAVRDGAVTERLLRQVASSELAGSVAARTYDGTEPPEQIEAMPGRAVGAEQSNSSVVYGDRYILKVFRRLAEGVNPDLEVTRRLADTGGRHIAPPLAWLEAIAPFPATLALLQPFLKSATEGWAMATTSVRDLLADPGVAPAEAGGDLAAETQRLGVVTAELHADLVTAFGAQDVSGDALRELAAQLHQRLADAGEEIPELAPHLPAARAAYDDVARLRVPMRVQRIHGDFHLGQVLRTDTGWVVIDFEGEPARPLADRTQPTSPLRDVAGMLRSFDYAARHLLLDRPDAHSLEQRALQWAERNRAAFLAGYAEVSDLDPSESAVLMRAFELDKAVYEVRYEQQHRPSWLSIPLAGIARLSDG